MYVKPLLFGGLAYFLIRGLQKVTAVQKFVYNIAGLPTIKIEGARALLTFNLIVTNQTAEKFDVTKISARILVNGVYVGDVLSVQPFSIYGNTSSTVPLSVNLEISNTILSLVAVLSGSGGAVTIGLDGSIQSGSLSVPLSFSKQIR